MSAGYKGRVTFTEPSLVEQVVCDMRLADWARGRNRRDINELFNGEAPFTDQEVEQNHINTNVNDLSATQIDMAARTQFGNALIQPDPLVNITLDYGPVYKKAKWGSVITREFNRMLKDSLEFQEEEESTFAQVVLHGIGPCNWSDRYSWCGESRGIEDVLIPGDTLRSLKNLPFFAIWRSWTVPELSRMINGPKVDKAWNLPLARKMLKWIDQEARRLMGNKYPDLWMPEKWQERLKEGSFYMTDQVPTLDVWDFYFWSDDHGEAGWKRRIIPDTWSNSGNPTASLTQDTRKYGLKGHAAFLYDSGSRNYATELSEICHFQFGDASAVAPFRYHSVRSLGFLIFAVCHLQNRLKCKIHDAVFENLLPYLRVSNPTDAERPLKIQLEDKIVIPEGVTFIPQAERWQINEGLVQMGVGMNQQTMAANSSAFSQRYDLHDENPDETATKTMAKMTSMDALVGGVLGRAASYQKFKFIEQLRRSFLPDSRDPGVRKFRLNCLKGGVPEEAMNISACNVTPVRVQGNGNRMLQMAIAEKLLAVRSLHAPAAQTEILRTYDAAVSNDYELANRLNPETPRISDTEHDSQILAGTLMLGLPITPRPSANPQEVVETLLHSMATAVQQIKAGGMPTAKELMGLQNLSAYISQNLKVLAGDKSMKSEVKEYGDDLGKINNVVKAMAQQFAEAQKKAAAQNGGDPELAAKTQALVITAQNKAKLAAESHAQRTAQKEIAFQQKVKQDQIKHSQSVRQKAKEHAVGVRAKDIETAANVRRGGMKSFGGEEE